MDCVFCEIVGGRSPATIVESWDDTIAFVPLSPVTDGHVLVVPKSHVSDFGVAPAVSARTMNRAAKFAKRYNSFNIITSAGRAATQSIDHLHIHVVPRSTDDGLMVPWGTIYGDDPTAPHWCRVARKLQEENGALRTALVENHYQLAKEEKS